MLLNQRRSAIVLSFSSVNSEELLSPFHHSQISFVYSYKHQISNLEENVNFHFNKLKINFKGFVLKNLSSKFISIAHLARFQRSLTALYWFCARAGLFQATPTLLRMGPAIIPLHDIV